jgi:uncharacterized metal-binding protein YceD (DUF177 family)
MATTMTRFERKSDRTPPRELPWSAPVALSEVPETGCHLELVADRHARAAIAELAGLSALPRLEARFDVTHHGRSGLRVVGHVSASVGQNCVVSLEPIENEIDEPIDLVFTRNSSPLRRWREVEVSIDDEPEPLIDDMIDLGRIATEFLLLAIDPYPRKPGAVFQTPSVGHDAPHPFAALATLKNGRRKGEGGGQG